MIQLRPLLDAPLAAVWQQPDFLPFTAERGYAHPAAIAPGAVWFVGVTPSYNQTLNVNGDPAAPLIFDLDASPSAFYGKERAFLASINPYVPYAHLDVLYQRESDQKLLQTAVAGPQQAFAEAQLAVTGTLFDHLTSLPHGQRPRAIVVANRLAQELLGFFHPLKPGQPAWLDLPFTEQQIKPHEEIFYTCPAWGDVPVIFTIPFSGTTARFSTPQQKAAKHGRLAATLKNLL